MRKLVLLVLLGIVLPAVASETVLFWDPIAGYDTGGPNWGTYYWVNPDIVCTQNHGGWIGAGSSLGPYSVIPPNQFVNISSGSLGQYTTIAVVRDTTARYGQVMVRMANQAGNFMRLAVCDVAAPEFPGYWDTYPWTGYSNAGPDLMWHPGGNLQFFNIGGVVNDTGVAPTTTAFYDVTLNYDWQNQTYEGWYNQTKLFGPVTFDGYTMVGTPKSLAIAGAYWSANITMVMDYWHWKVSGAPFTTYGSQIVATGTPAFSPDGGTYSDPVQVTITCDNASAVIRYTTDGSEPTESSTLYSGPVTVDRTMTLKARAWAEGCVPSAVKAKGFIVVYTHGNIPQGSVTIDGDLSDWPASAQWSSPFVFWNGTPLTSTTRAKFAWNNAADVLYVAVQTDEHSMQLGGHLVIGPSKDMGSNPSTGIGSTQLAFYLDNTTSHDVTVMNEFNYYPGGPAGGSITDGVVARYSYDSGTGLCTYEIALPLWDDWRVGYSHTAQPLSVGEVVYVYAVMQDTLGTANGTNLSYYGNAGFYNGAWDKAAALALMFGNADLMTVLAAMDAKPGNPNWNSQADLDGDGEITSTDLSICLVNLN